MPDRRLRRRLDARAHSSEPGSTEDTPPKATPTWAPFTLAAAAAAPPPCPGGPVAVAVDVGVAVAVPVGLAVALGVVVGWPKVKVGVGCRVMAVVPVAGRRRRRPAVLGLLLFLLRDVPDLVPLSPCEHRLLELLDWKLGELGLGERVPDARRPVTAEPAADVSAEAVERSGCELVDWFCVKMPTVSEYCGIAPMKNADCALSVVPVLAMMGLPSLIAAAVPCRRP